MKLFKAQILSHLTGDTSLLAHMNFRRASFFLFIFGWALRRDRKQQQKRQNLNGNFQWKTDDDEVGCKCERLGNKPRASISQNVVQLRANEANFWNGHKKRSHGQGCARPGNLLITQINYSLGASTVTLNARLRFVQLWFGECLSVAWQETKNLIWEELYKVREDKYLDKTK